MTIPKRHELHIRGCALCGEWQLFTILGDADRWIIKHAKFTHRKTSSYVEDAPRTLTVLFEGEIDNPDQDPGHYDPTSMLLSMISTLKEQGKF